MTVRLKVEGIRCFSTPQIATLRPLTVLVGENSAGKTTLLALCKIASSVMDGYSQFTSFNDPPFSLGSFEQIASHSRVPAGRVREFSIGIEFDTGVGDMAAVQARFGSISGQPVMNSWSFAYGSRHLSVERQEEGALRFSFRGNSGKTVTRKVKDWEPRASAWGNMTQGVALQIAGDWKEGPVEVMEFARQPEALRPIFGERPYAFAPIRTHPSRTYDPAGRVPDPEGSHIPMLLASLAGQTEPGEWKALQKSLEEFGSNSGLFKRIDVVRKGKKESDPFQIGVKGSGRSDNLVDVGYGVSQVLPLIVDSLQRSKANDLFLVQQPEVHLHPRAQAELGSFFARMAKKGRRFVVETHSDHLLDRIRMEVRNGRSIRADEVSILYFERGKDGAQIHNLELDSSGAILNAPPSYRQFFLNEELALLGD